MRDVYHLSDIIAGTFVVRQIVAGRKKPAQLQLPRRRVLRKLTLQGAAMNPEQPGGL